MIYLTDYAVFKTSFARDVARYMRNVPHKIARDVQFRRYLYLPGVCILIARIFAIAQHISRGAMEDATESQVSETAPASLTSLHVYGEHAAPLYEVPPRLSCIVILPHYSAARPQHVRLAPYESPPEGSRRDFSLRAYIEAAFALARARCRAAAAAAVAGRRRVVGG